MEFTPIEIPFEQAERQSLRGAKQASYHFSQAEQAVESSVAQEETLLSLAASMSSIAHSLVLLRGGTND